MQKLQFWLLFLIILISALTTQVDYSANSTSISPLSKESTNTIKFSAILTSLTLTNAFYQNKNILLNGTVSVHYLITIINCSVYYTSISGISGFSLQDEANMTVESSRFFPISHNELFRINGSKDNSLSITGSTIIGNTDSNFSIIQLTNSIDIYIANSNFLDCGTITTITTAKNVIFISNNITNFNVALNFRDNSPNILITKNYFINGLTALVFNNFNYTDIFNCNFNDFFGTQNIIFIHNFSPSQFIDGPIVYNYYSQDTSIDFNNDGFYDQPFKTPFFIDYHPLSYTFDRYYIINDQIALQTNYNETSLIHDSSHFSHLGWVWYILSLFYAIITILPVIILFKLHHRKTKV